MTETILLWIMFRLGKLLLGQSISVKDHGKNVVCTLIFVVNVNVKRIELTPG
jgi:hypothetical protein